MCRKRKMSVYNISQIRNQITKRIPTGLSEIDWLYGVTTLGNSSIWGLPSGKISLWAGKPGIGKSRAAITVSTAVASRGYRVLYFQNETDLGIFAHTIKNCRQTMPKNFCVSDSTALNQQLSDILRCRPNLIVVDSVNMIQEFNSGSDKDIRKVIEGEKAYPGYRRICQETGCHVILLSQLTKAGDPRGSTVLSHLVDIVFELVPVDNAGCFAITVGSKHRYGRIGRQFTSWWQHRNWGVECVTDYSREDELWCRTHGLKRRDLKEEVRRYMLKKKLGIFGVFIK